MAQLRNSVSTENEISSAIRRRSLSWCVCECECVRERECVPTPGSHVSVCVLSEGFLASLTDTDREFRESLFPPQHS